MRQLLGTNERYLETMGVRLISFMFFLRFGQNPFSFFKSLNKATKLCSALSSDQHLYSFDVPTRNIFFVAITNRLPIQA